MIGIPAAPSPAEPRDDLLLDHVVYLTDQLRRLKALLVEQGIRVPEDLGTLGEPSEEAFERLIGEALRAAAERGRGQAQGGETP